MNNLVLIRVVANLDSTLRQSVLREFRDDGPHRLRLQFEQDGRPRTVLISLHPDGPWIGRPAFPRRGSAAPGRLAVLATRQLRGSVLTEVTKPPADRIVTLHFADGSKLVAELAPHRANLVLVDAAGLNLGCAKHPRSSARRLAVGEPYESPSPPKSSLDPFGRSVEEIDSFIRSKLTDEEPIVAVLGRRLFGVGPEAAKRIVEESRATERTPAMVLARRLEAVLLGAVDPVIRVPAGSAGSIETLDPANAELLPWDPVRVGPEYELVRREDASATAGWFHDSVERLDQMERWGRGLVALLDKEIGRAEDAARRARDDLDGFSDPERYRREGEALLAGLHAAKRNGGEVRVSDPYDPAQGSMTLSVDPALSLPQAAEARFRQHRRAVRAQESCGERIEALGRRLERLGDLRRQVREPLRDAGLTELERGMREAGLAVRLEPETRAGRRDARRGSPRLEGVRVFISADGETILVGRHAPGNQRLTFKLAAPEDFWLHALGVPGAHVVVRNPERRSRPPKETLLQAASVAAWFSESREQPLADVQWTRKKYVRKLRGGPPGAVTVKRSGTVRVRPYLLGIGSEAH